MSRAAADEFEKILHFLETKSYRASIVNLTPEPQKIFAIVNEKY